MMLQSKITYFTLDQHTSTYNSVHSSTQRQESSRQRKLVGSRNGRLKDIFFLDFALFKRRLAPCDQVADMFVVPTRTDDSNSNVGAVKIPKRNFAFGSLKKKKKVIVLSRKHDGGLFLALSASLTLRAVSKLAAGETLGANPKVAGVRAKARVRANCFKSPIVASTSVLL